MLRETRGHAGRGVIDGFGDVLSGSGIVTEGRVQRRVKHLVSLFEAYGVTPGDCAIRVTVLSGHGCTVGLCYPGNCATRARLHGGTVSPIHYNPQLELHPCTHLVHEQNKTSMNVTHNTNPTTTPKHTQHNTHKTTKRGGTTRTRNPKPRNTETMYSLSRTSDGVFGPPPANAKRDRGGSRDATGPASRRPSLA